MLNGDGSENDKKPSMSNRKKTTLHLQHTFFVHFFAVVVGIA